MNDNEKRTGDDAPASTHLDEKQLSLVVRGVFWFAWLTARYRRAAQLASRIENQKADLN